MNPYAKEVIALRQRVDDLEYELRELRSGSLKLIGPLCYRWNLTGMEAKVVATLFLDENAIPQEVITNRVYGLVAEHGEGSNLVPVMVMRARRKLAPSNITIKTIIGKGYIMPPESRERMRAEILQ
jgi:DNA-binding response OmpR family regulator